MCIVRSNYARALGSLCPTLLNADPNEQHQRRERKVGRRRFASRRRRVYIYLLDSGGNGYYILSRALYLASMSVLSFAAATSLSWGGEGQAYKELWRCSVLLLSTGSSAEPH